MTNQLAIRQESLSSLTCKNPHISETSVEIFTKSHFDDRIKGQPQQHVVEKLINMMDFIRRDLGVRQPLDEYMKKRISLFIVQRYSDLSLSEVKLSFELALMGELDLNADDVNPFNDFNVIYVTKILNAYRRKRNNVNIEIHKALPEPEKQLTDEELNEIHCDWVHRLINCFELYCMGDHSKMWMINSFCFTYLERIGLVNITPSVKKAMMRRAEKRLKTEPRERGVSINHVLSKGNIKTTAMRDCVLMQFKLWFRDGVDLYSLIKQHDDGFNVQ